MSIKTTQRIKPATAREILLSEIPNLPCDALAALMDTLADCGASQIVSQFDNFIVSEFTDDDEEQNRSSWNTLTRGQFD